MRCVADNEFNIATGGRRHLKLPSRRNTAQQYQISMETDQTLIISKEFYDEQYSHSLPPLSRWSNNAPTQNPTNILRHKRSEWLVCSDEGWRFGLSLQLQRLHRIPFVLRRKGDASTTRRSRHSQHELVMINYDPGAVKTTTLTF